METIPNFQTQNLFPKSWMADLTTGLISHPPSSRIIIVNKASRMFNPIDKTSKRSKPG
jgi:hypothetical protein